MLPSFSGTILPEMFIFDVVRSGPGFLCHSSDFNGGFWLCYAKTNSRLSWN